MEFNLFAQYLYQHPISFYCTRNYLRIFPGTSTESLLTAEGGRGRGRGWGRGRGRGRGGRGRGPPPQE